MNNERGFAGVHQAGTPSEGMPYAIEAQLTRKDADGGVVGSYPPDVMNRLLRHHPDAVPGVGGAAMGGMVIGGERFDG